MRFTFAFASLLISVLAIVTDAIVPPVDSAVCRLGLCRFDQLFKSIEAQGKDPAHLRSFIGEDPADPWLWCTYADAQAERGDLDGASASLEHAIFLGPRMPAIIMHAINFDFGHERMRQALPLVRRVLQDTDSFNDVLFSYLKLSQVPAKEVLASVMPKQIRIAHSWLAWLRVNGANDDLLETWSWMKNNNLLDRENSVSTVEELWSRKRFRQAQNLWLEWLASPGATYPSQDKLANPAFDLASSGGPFDWDLTAPPTVVISRGNGLELTFVGSGNIAFSTLVQGTVVHSGKYRFVADVQSEGLTSDQRPFFHIYDAADSKTLDILSPQIAPNAQRSQLIVDFVVPSATRALMVQLERRTSDSFSDNGFASRIEGRLHLYRVSLRPAG